MKKNCPMDDTSKREYIKNLIQDLNTNIPIVRANLLGVIERNKVNG